MPGEGACGDFLQASLTVIGINGEGVVFISVVISCTMEYSIQHGDLLRLRKSDWRGVPL